MNCAEIDGTSWQPGTKFVVCDAGESTVDITAYQVIRKTHCRTHLREFEQPSRAYSRPNFATIVQYHPHTPDLQVDMSGVRELTMNFENTLPGNSTMEVKRATLIRMR